MSSCNTPDTEGSDRCDDPGPHALIGAAVAGDLATVEDLLARGADPNAHVGDGETSLHAAVDSDAPESAAVLGRLLAAGADPHVVGRNGWTPLHLAAARGKVEKARLLLDAGAEVDRRATIDGRETPLLEAARAGRPEAVPLLLERGADPFLRDETLGGNARETAEQAGRGCDPAIYAVLKSTPIELDADEILDLADLDGESREWLRNALAGYDAAESYRENADRLAREGRHAEVIRLLDAHAPGLRDVRPWARFVGAFRRRLRRFAARLRGR